MIQTRIGPRGIVGCRRYGPGDIGIEPVAGCSTFGVKRLPSEPIGSMTLTLANLVTGSAIQIETQGGATVANRTAASGTEVFNLSVYAAGNAANNLRIKVRKGTGSPYYQPWETLATAVLGSQSIYVSQLLDE